MYTETPLPNLFIFNLIISSSFSNTQNLIPPKVCVICLIDWITQKCVRGEKIILYSVIESFGLAKTSKRQTPKVGVDSF